MFQNLSETNTKGIQTSQHSYKVFMLPLSKFFLFFLIKWPSQFAGQKTLCHKMMEFAFWKMNCLQQNHMIAMKLEVSRKKITQFKEWRILLLRMYKTVKPVSVYCWLKYYKKKILQLCWSWLFFSFFSFLYFP